MVSAHGRRGPRRFGPLHATPWSRKSGWQKGERIILVTDRSDAEVSKLL